MVIIIVVVDERVGAGCGALSRRGLFAAIASMLNQFVEHERRLVTSFGSQNMETA